MAKELTLADFAGTAIEKSIIVAGFEGINLDVLKALEPDLVKGGKPAQIGEIRNFAGRPHIKTVEGWKFYGKGTGNKAKGHDEGAKQHEQQKDENPSQENHHLSFHGGNIHSEAKKLFSKLGSDVYDDGDNLFIGTKNKLHSKLKSDDEDKMDFLSKHDTWLQSANMDMDQMHGELKRGLKNLGYKMKKDKSYDHDDEEYGYHIIKDHKSMKQS